MPPLNLTEDTNAFERALAAWLPEPDERFTLEMVYPPHVATFYREAYNWLASRRAARDAGCVEFSLSREAVEGLKLRVLPLSSHHPACERWGNVREQCTCGADALVRELSDVLKED
jgi:hypothetical protein